MGMRLKPPMVPGERGFAQSERLPFERHRGHGAIPIEKRFALFLDNLIDEMGTVGKLVSRVIY